MEQMKVDVLVMILWMTFLVRFVRMEELLLNAFDYYERFVCHRSVTVVAGKILMLK